MILSVSNILDSLPQTLNSYTSSNITAGATTIPVRNINSFTTQYAAQIGKTGQEQSEVKVLNNVSGTSLTIYGGGTLTYDHPSDTPVYSIHYDKLVFERSTSGTAGTATPITNGTISITPDSLYTEYDDTTGISTYAYKTYYYNSVSGKRLVYS